MAVRTLTATLNLDAGQFNKAVNSTTSELEKFRKELIAAGKDARQIKVQIETTASAFDKYVTYLKAVNQQKISGKSAQDSFILGLDRELKTLGMTTTELKLYDAAQKRVLGLTKDTIMAIDAKTKALAASAAEERLQADLARNYAADLERQGQARLKLIVSLHDEEMALKEGTNALELQAAALLGVSEATLTAIKNNQKLREQYAQGAVQARELIADEEALARAMDAAHRENNDRDLIKIEQEREAVKALTDALMDETLVMKEGAHALEIQEAATTGLNTAQLIQLKQTQELRDQYAAGIIQAKELVASQNELATAWDRAHRENNDRDLIKIEDEEKATKKLIATLLEEEAVMTQGSHAVELQKAALTGASEATLQHIARVQRLTEQYAAGIIQARELVSAEEELAAAWDAAHREQNDRNLINIENEAKATKDLAEARRQADAQNAMFDSDKARLALQKETDAREKLITSLQQEELMLTQGKDALENYRLSALNATVADEALAKRVQELRKQYAEAEQRVRDLEAAKRKLLNVGNEEITETDRFIATLKRQIIAQKEAAEFAKGGARGLAEYRAAQLGCSEAAGPFIAQLKGVNNELNAVTRGAHGTANAMYELNVLTHEFASGRLQRAIGSFAVLLNTLALPAGFIFSLTITIGLLYGLSKPILEGAKAMQELTNQAKTLGVSTGYLQTIAVASDLLGIKTDKLTAGMGRLDQAFSRAKAGAKQQVDGFTALGVSLKGTYTNEELMAAVLKGWDKYADGPRKVAIATELFGKAGRELIPVLDKLSENLGTVTALTAKYGLNNAEAVQQGVELAHNMDLMGLASKGFSEALLGALGPSLNKFISQMSEGTAKLTAFLSKQSTIDAITKALDSLGKVLGFIGSTVHLALEYWPALAAAMGMVALASATVAPALTAEAEAAVVTSSRISFLALAEMNLVTVGILLTDSFAGVTAAAGRMALGTALASGAMEVATFAAEGLLAALGTVVGMLGGPLGIALIAATLGFASFTNAQKAAKRAGDDVKSGQTSLIGGLSSATDWLKKYRLSTDDVTKAMDGITGAAPDMVKRTNQVAEAHRQAANMALSQAKAEALVQETQLAGIASTSRAAAKAQSDAANTSRWWANASKWSGGSKKEQDGILAQASASDAAARNLLDTASTADAAGADLKKQAAGLTAEQALAANPQGSTVGGILGNGPKGPKSEAQKLQEKIKKMQLDITGQSAYLTSEGDPVAEARAKQRQEEIDNGIKTSSPQFQQGIDVAGQQAASKAAAEGYKKVLEAVKKKTEEATVAQTAWNNRTLKGDEASLKFTSGLKAQLAESMKRDATLKPGTVAYDNYVAAITKGAAAEDVASLATMRLADFNETLKLKAEGVTEASQGFKPLAEEAKRYADELQSIELSHGSMWDKMANKGQAKDRHQAADNNILDPVILKGNEEALKLSVGHMDALGKANAEYLAQVKEIKATWDDIIAKMPEGADKTKAITAEQIQLKNAATQYADAIESPAAKTLRSWSDVYTNMGKLQDKWMTSFIDDLAAGKMNFGKFAEGMLQDFLKMLLQAEIAKLATNAGTGLGNIFQTVMSSFAPGSVPAAVHHSGGIVGAPSATRSVDPSIFAGAYKYHIGGVAGLQPGEVPAILQKGEGVFTQDQMNKMGAGAKGSSAPPVSININNESGMAMGASQSGTSFDGEKWIVDVVMNHASRPGPLRNALRTPQ